MPPFVIVTLGMAAAKAGRKPPSGGGFGAPKRAAATLQDVIKGFGSNRLPKDFGTACVCGSGSPYSECCRPYHAGQAECSTTESVLRSRYSAFAYRLPEYIMTTTDPTNADWKKDKIAWARKLNREQMFDDFDFVKLDVGDAESGKTDDEAFLSFSVTLQPKQDLASPPMVFSERSRFVRTSSSSPWRYASGSVTSDAPGLTGTVLNK